MSDSHNADLVTIGAQNGSVPRGAMGGASAPEQRAGKAETLTRRTRATTVTSLAQVLERLVLSAGFPSAVATACGDRTPSLCAYSLRRTPQGQDHYHARAQLPFGTMTEMTTAALGSGEDH